MAESGVADHQGLRFRLRDGAQVVTVTLAALYVIGFIVANAYLARYEIVRFDLVRGRYVSAGLLCVFVAVIAASIGWPIGVEYRSGDGRGKSKKTRQITALLALTLGPGVVALILRVLLAPITAGHVPWAGLLSFTFVSSGVAATLGSAAHKFAHSRGSLRGRGVTPIRVMLVGLASVALASEFGQLIYPYIFPAFGGGAAVLAVVGVDSAATPLVLREAVGRPVALVDRDDVEVDLVTCADTTSHQVEKLSLPASAIRWTSLRGFVSARDAASVLCRRDKQAINVSWPRQSHLADDPLRRAGSGGVRNDVWR